MHLVEKIIIIVILIIVILRHVDVIKQKYLIIKLCFRAKKKRKIDNSNDSNSKKNKTINKAKKCIFSSESEFSGRGAPEA
jgi:hypothetical protein